MDFPHWLLQPKVNYKPDIIKENLCSTFQFISLYSKGLNAEMEAFRHIFIFARQTHTLEQILFIYVYFNYHFCYLLWQKMPLGHSWGDELSGMHMKTEQRNQVKLKLTELLKNPAVRLAYRMTFPNAHEKIRGERAAKCQGEMYVLLYHFPEKLGNRGKGKQDLKGLTHPKAICCVRAKNNKDKIQMMR